MPIRFSFILTVLLPAWLAASPVPAEPGQERDIRLVTLAPHLTELVFAVGAEASLVGAVEWSNYPPEAADVPRIGDAFRFDVERILELDASHALAWDGGTPEAAIGQLQSLGIEVRSIEIRGLADIGRALVEIGEWLGETEAGRQARAEFSTRLEAIRAGRPDQPAKTVFYQVSARPLYTLGGRHVINEVFELCDAQNLFAGLDVEAAVIDIESVLQADPFAMIAGHESDRGQPLSHWHQYEQLQAVRCERMLTVEPELLVRPTPRILDGAAELCGWLDEIRQAPDPACEIDRN